VEDFVARNFHALLGIDPIIFPVSSKFALSAKESGVSGDMWARSRFGSLEKYILESLDGGQRAKLKLINPIGVADHVVSLNLSSIDSKLELIRADMQTLDFVGNQLHTFKGDMEKDFEHQISRVENCILKMSERAESFFDEKLRLSNTLGLLKADQLKNEFEKQVIGDTSREVERHVSDIIDWMVEKSFKQWRGIYDYLNRRPSLRSDNIVGTIRGGGEFLLNRSALLDSIGTAASGALEPYDRSKESTLLTDQMRGALLQTAALEVGAVGIAAVLTTSLLDITGLAGAGVLAVMGFGILPYKRASIKKSMRSKVARLRENLATTLRNHFTRELDNSVVRIKDNISPYSTFVKTENDKLMSTQQKLKDNSQQLKDLRAEIETMFK
jgi:hypothetical protein